VAHPNLPDLAYCAPCTERLFPRCEASPCPGIGAIACLHVEPRDETICGRRLCPRHGHRWQVFGPHRIGLGRCEAHSDLRQLDDLGVIFQLTAGTVVLRAEERGRHGLPTLPAVRRILMKSRNRHYEVEQVSALFERLSATLTGQTPLRRDMKALVARNTEARARAVSRHHDEKEQGRQVFARILAELRASDLDQVADALGFSDYRPAFGGGTTRRSDGLEGAVFVRVPPDLRGLLIGRGGATINELQRRVGTRIIFERES
jgi:hypothetical protein